MANRIDKASARVYHWENLFVGGQSQAYLTPKAGRWLVRDIADKYGIPIPHLKTVNRRKDQRIAWAEWGEGHPSVTFNLHHKSVTAMLVVHEMTHLVVGQYGHDEDSARHGSLWLGTYARLLDDYLILPESVTLPSLHAHGFEHLHPDYGTPDKLWEVDLA